MRPTPEPDKGSAVTYDFIPGTPGKERDARPSKSENSNTRTQSTPQKQVSHKNKAISQPKDKTRLTIKTETIANS